MGKTPVKHTLAGYIIKKQTPKDTGQENYPEKNILTK